MKITKKTGIVLTMILASTIILPGIAGAFTATITGKTIDVTNIADVQALVTQIVGVMQTILFAIAGVFVVIAGYQYLTAQGDPEKTVNARNMLIYAIIAVGIGILATIISTLVLNFLKAA